MYRQHRAAAVGSRRTRTLAHRLAAARSSIGWSGFFVLCDPPPPFELTYEDRDLLKTVGRHVATQLAQHDADAGWPRAGSSKPTTG